MFDAKNIRAEMARNKITSAQLAKDLGISKNSICNKLTGKREFTLGEFIALADIVRCSLDYLAGRE